MGRLEIRSSAMKCSAKKPILHVLLVLAIVGAGAVATTGGGALSPVEELGKALFLDNISDPPRMSCAACHAERAGFTGPIAGSNIQTGIYRGAVPQRFGNRKPPTSAYAPFSPVFHLDETTGHFIGGNFWDGRATGEWLGNPAADQALGPFLNPVEQNMPSAKVVCDHVAKATYAPLFVQVWGSLDCSTPAGVEEAYGSIGLSIAAWEASAEVSPFDSKFDAYWRACLAAGHSAESCGLGTAPKTALDPDNIFTEQEFLGLVEFGEYCAPCHVSHREGPGGRPPLFTNNGYANLGVPRNPDNPFYRMDQVLIDGVPINPEGDAWVDLGLGGFLRTRPEFAHLAEDNDGKFRVPTVRNVARGPGKGFPKAYMHNGVFKSLEEVVHFYNTRDVAAANWPPPEVDRNVLRAPFGGEPLGDLKLSPEIERAIVAFMKTLDDGYSKSKTGN
jgi:cytochrome c peroxidase